MKKAVVIEIRDRATFIPALAIYLAPENEAERYLLARAGFGTTEEQQATYIILLPLSDAPYDPFDYPTHDRTRSSVHRILTERASRGLPAEPGEVLDVEYLLGETAEPRRPEREAVLD